MTNEDDFDMPNLDDVAMDVAMTTVAEVYRTLRAKGLSRLDAATIVAAMIKQGDD